MGSTLDGHVSMMVIHLFSQIIIKSITKCNIFSGNPGTT